MRSIAVFVLIAACHGYAPVAVPPSATLPAELRASTWPASQPDLAADVDQMVQFGNALCDCAAHANEPCARGVVAEMQLWAEDTHGHTRDFDRLSPEMNDRASTAADRILACGDEVLGSGSWCPRM